MGYHSGMKALKPYPPLIFAACAGAMIALRFVAPGPRSSDTELRGLGLALMGVASAVAGLAASLFKRKKTPVMPFQLPNALVTSGPYARSRNPMYLMLVVALIGLALWLRSATPPLVIPVFILVMNRVIIAPEEKRLEAHFGEEYRSYCRRVRRWI